MYKSIEWHELRRRRRADGWAACERVRTGVAHDLLLMSICCTSVLLLLLPRVPEMSDLFVGDALGERPLCLCRKPTHYVKVSPGIWGSNPNGMPAAMKVRRKIQSLMLQVCIGR